MRNGSSRRQELVSGEVLEFPSASVRLLGHMEAIRSEGVRPVRLACASWPRFPPNSEILRSIVCNASGVRLLARTRARALRLTVRCTRVDIASFVGPVNSFVAQVGGREVARARASADLVESIDLSGASAFVHCAGAHSTIELGPLPEGDKDVVIWLPQGMIVDLLDVAADQPVIAGVPPHRPRWIHHGSSISHCALPDLPTSAWPVVTAGLADLDLLNLGFGGNCMLDPFVADAIAQAPADVISIKVGVNIVGARSMDRRTFVPALHGFLDRVRRGHPKLPIVVASSILWPGSETRPGPSDVEFLGDGKLRCFTAGNEAEIVKGALTMEESRLHVAHAVAARLSEGDNIVYLDGLSLYGPGDVASFVMPDALHPEADLYEEMGRRFAELVFGERGLVPRSMIVPEKR